MPSDVSLEPGLFVTATPIGNLGDMSRRAVEVLKAVNIIACEDTRVTSKLLRAYGIETPMVSYHDHNAARARPGILKRLKAGEAVALVSDAGTPLVSDPGYKLVQEAIEANIPVRPVPGASAALAALAVAGLPSDRFLFAGFLPTKKGARDNELRGLAGIDATIIFYESGKRLPASLAAMVENLGAARQAAVCRELTKLHEETRRGSLQALAGCDMETRGEFVIVVGPPGGGDSAEEAEIDRLLTDALERLSVREAAHAVAYMTGARRRDVYQRALGIGDRNKGG